MKTGTENKTQVRLAIVLGVVAILTVAWTLMPKGEPQRASTSVSTAAKENGKTTGLTGESLDPRLRLELLASSENVKYEGNGTNIFRAGPDNVEVPQAKVSPLLRQQQQAKLNNIPPPPPPINLKYFGISDSKGEKPKAFLSQGDDVWIAREGDVVDRHYKIVRISPTAVEVEDLLNNNRQSISRTQG